MFTTRCLNVLNFQTNIQMFRTVPNVPNDSVETEILAKHWNEDCATAENIGRRVTRRHKWSKNILSQRQNGCRRKVAAMPRRQKSMNTPRVRHVPRPASAAANCVGAHYPSSLERRGICRCDKSMKGPLRIDSSSALPFCRSDCLVLKAQFDPLKIGKKSWKLFAGTNRAQILP